MLGYLQACHANFPIIWTRYPLDFFLFSLINEDLVSHCLRLRSNIMFYQRAADQLRGNLLGGAAEEGLREVLGGSGGYGSGMV